MYRTTIGPGSKAILRTAVLVAGVAVLAAVFLTTAATPANRSGAVVKLGHSGLGQILVDSHGRTLYLWAHDKHHKSTCYGYCAAYWPAPSCSPPSSPRPPRRTR